MDVVICIFVIEIAVCSSFHNTHESIQHISKNRPEKSNLKKYKGRTELIKALLSVKKSEADLICDNYQERAEFPFKFRHAFDLYCSQNNYKSHIHAIRRALICVLHIHLNQSSIFPR